MNDFSQNLLWFFRILMPLAFAHVAVEELYFILGLIYGFNEFSPKNFINDIHKFQELDLVHYIVIATFIICYFTLHLYFIYKVMKLFKELEYSVPFQNSTYLRIRSLSIISLLTGLSAIMLIIYLRLFFYQQTIVNEGNFSGKAFLYGSAVIYIISQLFKKGVDLKNENDLTI